MLTFWMATVQKVNMAESIGLQDMNEIRSVLE